MAAGLSIWIQFIRNLACVIKTLIPQSSFLHNSYDNSIHNPSYLEILISITQFYVVFVAIFQGIDKIKIGWKKYKILSYWNNQIHRLILLNKDMTVEMYLMKLSIENNLSKVFYNDIIASCIEIVFGFCFISLGLNSLHIYLSDHPKTIIDSLIVMEIGLIYFLVMMWNTCIESCYTAEYIDHLIKSLSSIKSMNNITNQVLTAVNDSGYDSSKLVSILQVMGLNYNFEWFYVNIDNHDNSSNRLKNEIESLAKALENLTVPVIIPKKAAKVLGITFSYSSIVSNLEKFKSEKSKQQYFDFIYLLLNFIAFYGYLIGIFAYYTPHRLVVIGISPTDADWWGVLGIL